MMTTRRRRNSFQSLAKKFRLINQKEQHQRPLSLSHLHALDASSTNRRCRRRRNRYKASKFGGRVEINEQQRDQYFKAFNSYPHFDGYLMRAKFEALGLLIRNW